MSPGVAGGGSPGGTTAGGGAGGSATADLSVTVIGSVPSDPNGQAVASYTAGETARYFVDVRNSAPGAADGAVVTVPLTTGLSPGYSHLRIGNVGASCDYPDEWKGEP